MQAGHLNSAQEAALDSDREAAFEAFVLTRQASLLRLAFLLCGDLHHAEDLVQGTLERAYQHWRRVAAAGNPEAYVRRILVNTVTDWRRSRRYVVEQSLDAALALPSPGEGSAERLESHDVVVRALRGLPARMRAVLVLRYFQDLSETETASVLGCSVGTVKSQASRGLARLREAMEPRPSVGGIRDRSAS
jgi:RNA polymerase sigma-70 factor (sigma-E family)